MLAVGSRDAAGPPRIEQLPLALGAEPDAVHELGIRQGGRDGVLGARKVSPASVAREASTSMKCRQPSFEGSIQSGSSIHSPTPCPVRNASSTSTARAAEPETRPAALDHRPHRRTAGRVERPREPFLGGPHHPGGEVAHVDELDGPPGRGPGTTMCRRAGRGAAST